MTVRCLRLCFYVGIEENANVLKGKQQVDRRSARIVHALFLLKSCAVLNPDMEFSGVNISPETQFIPYGLGVSLPNLSLDRTHVTFNNLVITREKASFASKYI